MEYEDVIMDHKYFMEAILNRANPSMFGGSQEGTARLQNIDYRAGIRTFVLKDKGQIVDKNEAMSEDEGVDEASIEQAVRALNMGIASEVREAEQGSEAMAKLARNNELLHSEGDSKSGISNLVLEDKAAIKLQLKNKISTGGARLFLLALSLYSLIQLASVIAPWTLAYDYWSEVAQQVRAMNYLNKFEIYLNKATSSIITICLLNRGLNFPPQSLSVLNRTKLFAQELKESIEQIDEVNRNIGSYIYALPDTRAKELWSDSKNVDLLAYDGVFQEKFSVNNALQALIGEALEMKNGDLTTISIDQQDIVFFVRNAIGSLLTNINSVQSVVESISLDRNTRLKSLTLYFFVAHIILLLFVVAALLATIVRISRKQISLFKVFYSFTSEDLQAIQSEVSAHLDSMKHKDMSTLMSVSNALREVLDIDIGQGVETHKVIEAAPKKHWNRVVNRKRVATLVDISMMFLAISLSVAIGLLILQVSIETFPNAGQMVRQSASFFSMFRLASYTLTAATLGFSKDLKIAFDAEKKVLINPQQILTDQKSTFMVTSSNPGNVRFLCKHRSRLFRVQQPNAY